ncbi:nucleoside 2-deoxyribosyltransferase [Clostridium tagluense]|uniref:Nucleoside 2-deoxyribosyltransferase n=1 Tax=Clostridium tagluense TaxID=360422 RepID=A0A401ULP7_9CLOT|nr:nucleoside 2-deoxyribosyltransferase [Clostridium tagluense]GCD10454.1 hypothetical protein Ctaglu_20770 [Clostridium tagluense]
MKKCFIVCPIGDENTTTRKRSDLLFKHIITPVCESCELDPIRVDHLNDTDSITETIIKNLKDSDLVIADLTEHNPNAFFELGYRFALGKPVIHLSQKGTKLPFDISAIRTLPYDLSDLDAVEELKTRLIKTIQNINFDESTSVIENQASNFNAQILQEIFKIQDSIKQLTVDISHKDTSAVSVLADKLIQILAQKLLRQL